eukprot:1140750-Pelagomonas_calceolata.AAC.6
MKELGCYTDAHRREIDINNYWACPACTHLSEDKKPKRESSSFNKELVRIDWEPSWEPEDIKETWPTFLQCILEFETPKDEPDLSIAAADLQIDNLQRQGFEKTLKTNTLKQKLDTDLRNKAIFDINPTNPQADIHGTGRYEFWITTVDFVRPKPNNITDPHPRADTAHSPSTPPIPPLVLPEV